MPSRQQLAEFDYVLLGAVYRGYPTGYSIRNLILRTKGSRWSGSTGAVYPALRRLEASGYLAAETAGKASRARTSYSLTPKGTEALRRWMMGPVSEEDLGMMSDPLRSRCLNLRLLKPRERVTAVRQWIEQNEAYIAYFTQRLGELPGKDRFVDLAFLNLAHLLEGRRRWLLLLADEVGLKLEQTDS
ncbi:MAG: PadR family transcriptional regulator [Fimbriimonadia bacterium]|jgi:DNA-binding PadR family transcriptional regulator